MQDNAVNAMESELVQNNVEWNHFELRFKFVLKLFSWILSNRIIYIIKVLLSKIIINDLLSYHIYIQALLY